MTYASNKICRDILPDKIIGVHVALSWLFWNAATYGKDIDPMAFFF